MPVVTGTIAVMSATMAVLGTAMVGLGLAVKGAQAAVGMATKTAQLSISWTKSLIKGFSGIDLSLKNLGKTFEASIAAADQLQKRNLALGRDFGGFSKAFDSQVSRLPGVLSERLGTTMSMVEAGLRGNTLRTRQLTQTVRMTGGNWKKLSSDLAQTQTSLALNNAALEDLSVATSLARDKYGVAADQMIGAIGQLNSTVKANAVLSDAGGPLAQAIVSLTGRLGGKGGAELGRVAELLMGGGKSFAEAHILGVEGARATGSRGDAASMETALLEIIRTGAASAASFRAGMGDMDPGLAGMTTTGVMQHAADLRILFEALNVEQTSYMKAMQKNRKVTDQLSEIGKKLWEPIQEMWLDGANGLFQKLIDNAKLIQDAFTTFIVKPLTTIIEKFTELFLNNEDFYEGLRSIFVGIGSVLLGVNAFLSEKFGGEGGESFYSWIIKSFGNAVKTVAGIFESFAHDLLPKLELGFFGMIESILTALDKVGIDVNESTFTVIKEAREGAMLDVMVKDYQDNLAEGKTKEEAMGIASSGGFQTANMEEDFKRWTSVYGAADALFGDVLAFTAMEGARTKVTDDLTGKTYETETMNPAEYLKEMQSFHLGTALVGGLGPQMGKFALEGMVGNEEGGLAMTAMGPLQKKYDAELDEIKAQIQADRAAAITGRKGERGKTITERVDALTKAALEGSKGDTELQESWTSIFDDFKESLKKIAGNTEEEENVPQLLESIVDEQSQMLSNSIAAILMDAKQEELLRVQYSVIDELFGIKINTVRQVALAEDAALTPSLGTR